ncbi:MAG TPA: MBL fold metallo-hydrolase [Nevskiaceae bacterium]|nr:MBL fold metallo-hydrolase [Nevskiaceae bacterium]
MITLRSLLCGLALGAGALVPAHADEPARELAPGLLLLPGQLQESRSPDGNSVLLLGTEGLLVVDTGRNDAHTQALLGRIAQLGVPVRAVVNTHWHLDHIGGNAQFKARLPEVRILAHPSLDTALATFHAENRAQLQEYLATTPPDAPIRPRLTAELELLKLDRLLAHTDPVTEPLALNLGERVVEVRVAAHSVTEGDLWLWDPASRTVIAGDLVTLPVPLFDTACPEGWQATLASLDAVEFATLIPGHGQPLTKAEFALWRDAFDRLLACAANPGAKPRCVDAWMKDLAPLTAEEDDEYARQLLNYYFDNNLNPLAPGRKRWCGAVG